jgi:hypothetical protein
VPRSRWHNPSRSVQNSKTRVRSIVRVLVRSFTIAVRNVWYRLFSYISFQFFRKLPLLVLNFFYVYLAEKNLHADRYDSEKN